ncbi:MAG: hypothetical protein JNG90_01385 [Planctomycetaceae bacterium]|nr:hypothetical protein [Planctomycetaceae bacterium]
MARWNTMAEAQREKFELRAEIARQRRTVDRDLQRLSSAGSQLTSWKTYVARFPAQAVGMMFGVGLILGAGWRSTSWRKQLGRWIFSAGLAGAKSISWSDLLTLWSSVRDSFGNRPDR